MPNRLSKKSNVSPKSVAPTVVPKQSIITKQNKSEAPQGVVPPKQEQSSQQAIVNQDNTSVKSMPATQSQHISRTNSSIAHTPVVQETALPEINSKVPVVENPFKGIKHIAPAPLHVGGVKTDVHSRPEESVNILGKKSKEERKIEVYKPEQRPSLMERALKKQKNYYSSLVDEKLVIDDKELGTSYPDYHIGQSTNVSNKIEKNSDNTEHKTDTSSIDTKIVTKQNKKHETIQVESQDWGPYLYNKANNATEWMWDKAAGSWNYLNNNMSLSNLFNPFDYFMRDVEIKDSKTHQVTTKKKSMIEAFFINTIKMDEASAKYSTKIATVLLVLAMYTIPSLQKSDSILTQFLTQSILPATVQISLGGASVGEVLTTHGMSALVGANLTTSNAALATDKVALLKCISSVSGFAWSTTKTVGSYIAAPLKWMFGIGSTANASATVQNTQAQQQSTVASTPVPVCNIQQSTSSQITSPVPQLTNTQAHSVTPPQLPVQPTNHIAQPAASVSPGWIPWLYNWSAWIITFKAACAAVFPAIWAQVKNLPTDSLGIKIGNITVNKAAVQEKVDEGCVNKFGPNVSDETKHAFYEAFLKRYANEMDPVIS
jgi:hypothetical protein